MFQAVQSMGVLKYIPPTHSAQNERMHPRIERRELQNERGVPVNERGDVLLERFNKLNVATQNEEVTFDI